MHRGLGETRVTKEILVHKGHLEVVVLGLRVLKPHTTTATQGPKGDTGPISPKGDKVVLEVEMVIKGTLEHRDPNVIKVIEDQRGYLVVTILQTLQLFHNRPELR